MFIKRILSLLTGTAVGQAVVLISMPVMTRLYSPSQFSTVALLVGIASIASVIATMRYEVAIVLPKSNKSAEAIVSLAFLMAIIVSLFLMVGISLYWAELYRAFSSGGGFSTVQSGRWIFLIPLMTFFMSLYSILNMWNCRNHRFGRIALATTGLQGGYALIAIIAGSVSTSFNGMIVGRTIGQIAGCFILLRGNLLHLVSALRRSFSKEILVNTAREFCQFPIFNAPYSLLGTISREAILIIFSMTGSFAAAGGYVLARTVLYAPVMLVSASIGPVFYRDAASNLYASTLQQRTLYMFFGIAMAALPFYIFAAFWGAEIFLFIFGAQWGEAGEFFSLLIPVGFMMLLTSWPERVFEVANRQNLSLSLQLVFDTLSVGAVIIAIKSGFDASECIALYAVITTVFHFTYLIIVFKLMRLHLAYYFKLVVLIIGLSATIWLAFLMSKIFLGQGLYAFTSGAIFLLISSAVIGITLKKYYKKYLCVSVASSNVSGDFKS